MRTPLVIAMFLAMTGVAAAGKLLVLHSDGNADAKTRARIDAAVLRLAQSGKDAVTPSEITYNEATAMVGCKPEDASCRDEVINTLAVDELLIVNVNNKAPGFEVTIRRAGKGGKTHDASTNVTADKLDKVEALGPVFGLKAPVVVEPPKPPVTDPIGPTKPPVTQDPIGPTRPPVTDPTRPPVTDPNITKPPVTDPNRIDEPNKVGDVIAPIKKDPEPIGTPGTEPRDKPNRKRLYVGGMATGGAMMLIGFIAWGAESSVQGDIDATPNPRNQTQLTALRDLEDRAGRLATTGNVFFVSGLVVTGVSTYLYIRHRRNAKRSSSSAMLVPSVFDHGAGLTLSFGGGR
jgi:hypothetical protein